MTNKHKSSASLSKSLRSSRWCLHIMFITSLYAYCRCIPLIFIIMLSLRYTQLCTIIRYPQNTHTVVHPKAKANIWAKNIKWGSLVLTLALGGRILWHHHGGSSYDLELMLVTPDSYQQRSLWWSNNKTVTQSNMEKEVPIQLLEY